VDFQHGINFLSDIKKVVMSGFRKPGKSQDRRIHLEQPHEAVYWSKKFEVSSVQLYKAVQAAGSNKVEKVASYLFQRQ
jgi:hypothetical protein